VIRHASCRWLEPSALAFAMVFGLGCGDDAADGDGKDAASSEPLDAASPDRRDSATADKDSATADVDSGNPIPADCPEPAPNQPPELLSCAGLYSDIEAKTLTEGVREFAPAVPLWSDGADKTRWIYLPPGQKIDVSDPDSWRFPVGTRLFKEFRRGDTRVETRLFWKRSASYWARTAYQWNADETEATRTGGADVEVDGSNYHIPSTTECDQCHKGRIDRVLGFEAISLGLAGATGVTLKDLQDDDLLDGDALPTELSIGDDGTGKAADALGWMHTNCGVSCHNGNSASEAYSTHLRLDLKVAEADGRAPTDFDSLTTTIDVDATTGRWLGSKRIAPGAPADSLLYTLMSSRNPGEMKDQMPPIASVVVPEDAAALINAWISAM
jgi:hypothetical protein